MSNFWNFKMIWMKRRNLSKIKIICINQATLREKCSYLDFFSPNVGKYRPEKPRIRTLFTQSKSQTNPARIYLLKVNNRSIRTRCGICSKITIKLPERRQWRCPGIYIVNFKHISHLTLVFLLLTLNM